MRLFGLQADQFVISRPDIGESFTNFRVAADDLYIGDRAYGRLKGIRHIVKCKGHYIARLKNKSFKIVDSKLNELNLPTALGRLRVGEIKNIRVVAEAKKQSSLKMRICAIRKSDGEAEKSIEKALEECSKKQRRINTETIELHRCIILVSSLPETVTAKRILDLYRIGWQMEIAFKRFKGILGLGHLPKTDEASARAWLHGKMFVALLAQAVIDEGRFFSPWGYPI